MAIPRRRRPSPGGAVRDITILSDRVSLSNYTAANVYLVWSCCMWLTIQKMLHYYFAITAYHRSLYAENCNCLDIIPYGPYHANSSRLVAWHSGRTSVIGRRTFTMSMSMSYTLLNKKFSEELSLSCARPAFDEWPVIWLNRPLLISQLGQLSLLSFRGRWMGSKLQSDVRSGGAI